MSIFNQPVFKSVKAFVSHVNSSNMFRRAHTPLKYIAAQINDLTGYTHTQMDGCAVM